MIVHLNASTSYRTIQLNSKPQMRLTTCIDLAPILCSDAAHLVTGKSNSRALASLVGLRDCPDHAS